MNRRQGEVLEYVIEEIRVLRERLKGRGLRLSDDQRRGVSSAIRRGAAALASCRLASSIRRS
jgi:hypothetical protein